MNASGVPPHAQAAMVSVAPVALPAQVEASAAAASASWAPIVTTADVRASTGCSHV
jgi:hypothetical protein